MQAYMQLDTGTVIRTANPEYWPEAKRLPVKQGKAILQDEARAFLLNVLQPGDTVHCVLRHVSRSGMLRRIDLYKLQDNDRIWLSGMAARLLDENCDADQGIKVTGCGMDMGFHLVYSLSRRLFPEGFKVEGRGRNGDTSGWDDDGGYALRSQWL